MAGSCLIGDLAADCFLGRLAGVPQIGEVAADTLPGAFTGVPSMRLAPVLVLADTLLLIDGRKTL